MRLVFLYHADKHAPRSGLPILYNQKATNRFVEGVKEEGYFWLLKRMLETKVVDEILLVVESTEGQGHINYMSNFTGWVLPDINQFDPHLREDDIIWCRGGHRSNHDFLVRASKKDHWLMLYAANTGRQRWKFWNIILTDSGVTSIDKRGRFWFYWKKPINPEIFKLINQERIYDICVGASHIQDKKGQWKIIEALIKYKKKFNKNLKCVLPGAFRHGIHSNFIEDKINKYSLDVNVTGLLSRPDLAKILNQSKLFIHAGSSGENDRGPLEAMRCGCYLIIANPKYHSPITYSNPHISYVFKDEHSFKETAFEIDWSLVNWNGDIPKKVVDYYELVSGFETVVLPEMTELIKIMRNNKPGDLNVFQKLLN